MLWMTVVATEDFGDDAPEKLPDSGHHHCLQVHHRSSRGGLDLDDSRNETIIKYIHDVSPRS